jgi:hypothetical protein
MKMKPMVARAATLFAEPLARSALMAIAIASITVRIEQPSQRVVFRFRQSIVYVLVST